MSRDQKPQAFRVDCIVGCKEQMLSEKGGLGLGDGGPFTPFKSELEPRGISDSYTDLWGKVEGQSGFLKPLSLFERESSSSREGREGHLHCCSSTNHNQLKASRIQGEPVIKQVWEP